MKQCALCGQEGGYLVSIMGRDYVCKSGRQCRRRRGLSYSVPRSVKQRGSSESRDMLGVTVTFRERVTGWTTSETRPGLVITALAELLARFPVDEWRVQSISTARTVLSDLRGRPAVGADAASPEAALLSKVPGGLGYLA